MSIQRGKILNTIIAKATNPYILIELHIDRLDFSTVSQVLICSNMEVVSLIALKVYYFLISER